MRIRTSAEVHEVGLGDPFFCHRSSVYGFSQGKAPCLSASSGLLPSRRLIPSWRRTNTWTPHSSHCQYGLPRWVRFTGTSSLQTGHGISSGHRAIKRSQPFGAACSQPSYHLTPLRYTCFFRGQNIGRFLARHPVISLSLAQAEEGLPRFYYPWRAKNCAIRNVGPNGKRHHCGVLVFRFSRSFIRFVYLLAQPEGH